jgi:hypothetical protein
MRNKIFYNPLTKKESSCFEYNDFSNAFLAILHVSFFFMFIYCRQSQLFVEIINSRATTLHEDKFRCLRK